MTKQAVKMAVESDPQTESYVESVLPNLSEPVGQQEVAELAYQFWQARGCPDGSPEEDWFRAEQELQSRVSKTS